MSAVANVQTYLAAQTLIDGDTTWPSVRRRVHDETNQLVIISEDGGPSPEIKTSSGIGSDAQGDIGVQVRVRAEPWEGDSGYDKAVAILNALHGLLGTEIGSATYRRVVALTTEPVFLGFDDNNRPEFTTSFLLMAEVPA